MSPVQRLASVAPEALKQPLNVTRPPQPEHPPGAPDEPLDLPFIELADQESQLVILKTQLGVAAFANR